MSTTQEAEKCPVVALTVNEILSCHYHALQRITASEAQDLNHASTYTRPIRTRLDEESVGVIGERALARWLDCYFACEINTFHASADCAGRYEVRSTAMKFGRLIVRDNDVDERAFVLALVGLDGRVILRGWCFGWEAKQDLWIQNPGGIRQSWFVPQEALHPMSSLPGRPS